MAVSVVRVSFGVNHRSLKLEGRFQATMGLLVVVGYPVGGDGTCTEDVWCVVSWVIHEA